MTLPNAERAIVDVRKLRDHCLSTEHPRGRHKARVFESARGFTAADADELRAILLAAARSELCAPSEQDEYRQRYVIDLGVNGSTGQATVRSTWILRAGEDFPRLITCYVL